MSAEEQKHYLYDHVFKALNASSGYEDFKNRLAEESIRVTEHVNSKGGYGISFYMENVEDPHVFKGADLSRKQGGDITSILGLDITGSGNKSQEDDFIPSKKKRKRKSGPDFSL